MWQRWQVFNYIFCDVARPSNTHKEDVAKFGYRSDIKVKKLQNSFIVWLPAGICCRNLVMHILFFFPKSGELGAIFCTKILFIFHVEIMRIFAKEKETLVGSVGLLCQNPRIFLHVELHSLKKMAMPKSWEMWKRKGEGGGKAVWGQPVWGPI